MITITLTRLSEMLKGIDNWILVLVDFYQQTKQNPVIQSLLKEKYRQWISGIEALVVVLQKRGWIPQDKDTQLIAKQVIAFNEGYTIFSILFGGSDPQAHMQGLVKLMS